MNGAEMTLDFDSRSMVLALPYTVSRTACAALKYPGLVSSELTGNAELHWESSVNPQVAPIYNIGGAFLDLPQQE